MLDMKYGLTYAATSANLLNFLGHHAFDDHFRIFNATLKNASKAHRDLLEFGSESLEIIDPFKTLELMDARAPIFVTFHTGSYNMLASLLLKMGRQIYVLSDTSSVNNGEYNSISKIYSEKYNNGCSSEMLNVEIGGTIFNIIKKIRQGALMIAYLDGNKGIGGQTKDNENLLDIDFLNGVVKVRRGLAFISYVTGSPLVLALNYTSGGKDFIRFYEPIRSEEKDKESACVSMMNQIFKHFEEHVRLYPEQWSNWAYVHKWADLTAFKGNPLLYTNDKPVSTGSKSWRFNSSRFCPLRVGENYFLFDRILYQVIPVKNEYTELFSKNTSAAQRNSIFESLKNKEKSTIGRLIDRQIIIEE